MLHLKMILRSWFRNGLSTAISLISLTVGLVCSTMLILFVVGEYRIAGAITDGDNLYLLQQTDGNSSDNVTSTSTPSMLALKCKNSYADVKQFATFSDLYLRYKDGTGKSPEDKFYLVTQGVTDIFDIPIVQGDLSQTLSSASEIAVTERFMQQVFGRHAVLGEQVVGTESGYTTVINGITTEKLPSTKSYTITTILDDSRHLPLKIGALAQFTPQVLMQGDDVSINSHTSFVLLHDGVSPTELKAKIVRDSLIQSGGEKLELTPFDDIYFSDNLTAGSKLIAHRSSSLLKIGLTVALAILLIAAFNYVNITMTRARGRIKNMAAERIFGASKWSVRWQTVMDTALLVGISLCIAVMFIAVLLPQFNGFMDSTIKLGDLFTGYNLLAMSAVLVTLIALPSLYILLRIEIASPMENFKNPEGRSIKMSGVMVVLQFVISIVLVVVSINIARQINFIELQHSSSRSVIRVTDADDKKLSKEFLDYARNLAGVQSATTVSPFPSSRISNDDNNVNFMQVNKAVLDLFEIEIIEGRMLDQTDAPNNGIVNEALLRNFAIKQPFEGQKFTFAGSEFTIVGVMRDFMYEDALKTIQPLMMRYLSDDATIGESWGVYIKVSGDVNDHIDYLRGIWAKTAPAGSSFKAETLAQIYRDMNPQQMRMKTMVEIFMYISMLLTAMGLFGLSYYMVQRRRREIAIRKVHGSTTARMIAMLCRSFASMIGIALALALPVAYFLSDMWLAQFVYHVPIAAWVFIVTVVIAATITFVTVIFQTWIAASANPAKSIMTE